MIDQADNHHPSDGPPRELGRGLLTRGQAEPAAAPTAPVAEKRPSPLSLSDRVRSLKLPDQPKQARSQGSWFPWLLCLLLGGISGYLGYRAYTTEPAAKTDDASLTKSSDPDAKAPELLPGQVALNAGGYVVPIRRVQIAPKVGGEVIELLKINGRELQEGDFVKKGQWLARLDRSKYEFEYQRMKALEAQAEADLKKLEAGGREEEKKQTNLAWQEAAEALKENEENRDLLKDEANRLRRSRQASSAEELVRVESRLVQAELKVQQVKLKMQQLEQVRDIMKRGREEDILRAKATLAHAVAQRDNAKYDLDMTEVVAPVTGIILKKNAEVGNTVRPEAFSNGLSASLCEMADLKELEVDVDISERDLTSVYRGQKCEVRTEAFPEKVYQGVVSRLWPEANRSKASVSARVRIDIPDNDVLLRPEMRARVAFLAKEKDKK